MDQDRCALHVTQKAVAETRAGVGAGDEPRYIGQNKDVFVTRVPRQFGDAQIWAKRGKWVVAHARMGRARRGQQARFSGVGLADQRRVSDGLQLQVERPLFAWLTLLCNTRCALGPRGEVGVAQTTPTAAGDHNHVAGAHQVGQHAIF